MGCAEAVLRKELRKFVFEPNPGSTAGLANLTSCQTTAPHGLLRRARAPYYLRNAKIVAAAPCLDVKRA